MAKVPAEPELVRGGSWGNTFPGAACVVALVDCFAQHCHRVEILGESYRDKHRLDPDRPPPSTSKSRTKRS